MRTTLLPKLRLYGSPLISSTRCSLRALLSRHRAPILGDLRCFAHTPRFQRDKQLGDQIKQNEVHISAESSETPRPETTQKPEPPRPDEDAKKNAGPKTDALLSEQTLSNKEQRKADWAIMKEMAQYLWPKGDIGAKTRVGTALALLVGSKVLNVQVPFYFKSIVDSMNVDFVALGGTAWTVGGSMIIACMHESPRL